jgi:hypothetical protein
MPAEAGIQELLNGFPAAAGRTTEKKMLSIVNNIIRPLII